MLPMAISIQKALELPIMKDTSLVAGVGGIKNNIKWVTTVEIIEDIKRLQEGEFLITTGFGLLENKSQMKAFHDLITSQLLSGIAIYTSFYMKEIPASFINLANEHELPLIEIPTDINFSEITKVLLEQIVNNQMHLLEEAENVHRKLTNLILNDWSLNEVTTKLAKLTNATIVIYNELHEIIYHSNGLDSQGHLNEDLFKKMDMSAIMQDSLEREEKVNIIDQGHMYTIYPI